MTPSLNSSGKARAQYGRTNSLVAVFVRFYLGRPMYQFQPAGMGLTAALSVGERF